MDCITEFRCALDRIEGEHAIIIPEDGTEPFEIPADLVPHAIEGKKYLVRFKDGAVFDIKPIEDGENAQRLRGLFNKSKN